MAKKSMITKAFRCAFPNLDEARNFQGQGTLKYSINALIPKGKAGASLKAEIEEFVKAAVDGMAEWTAADKKKVLANALKNEDSDFFLFKDGDTKDTGTYPFFAGHYVVKFSRNIKGGVPSCVYADTSPIPAPLIRQEIYSGCWIRAEINAYCYSKPKMGISLTLNGVQKVKDDTSFKKSAFDPIDSEDVSDDDTDISL